MVRCASAPLQESENGFLVASPGDAALEDLARPVDHAPKTDHLAIELHVHLVVIPAPLPEASHSADPLLQDISREHWPEPVPPHPHRLVRQIDPAFEQQVLDVPQRQKKRT